MPPRIRFYRNTEGSPSGTFARRRLPGGVTCIWAGPLFVSLCPR